MTATETKQLLAQVVDELPPEKVAELVEFAQSLRQMDMQPPRPKPRILGAFEGQLKILPGFYDPLPDDLLDEFECKPG
jgi:hypothetical protein